MPPGWLTELPLVCRFGGESESTPWLCASSGFEAAAFVAWS